MKYELKNVIDLTWPSLVIVVSLVLILRITYYFKGGRRHIVLYQELFQLLFLVYLIVLWGLVTSQELPGGGTNYMPFREILRYDFGTKIFYKQVLGNIVLFIPFGYFASSYCKIKNIGTITLVSLLSSSVIEIVQHYINRSFDIDDIILNTIGGILGFLLWISITAIKNHLPKPLQHEWLYNVISVVFVASLVFYLIHII